MQQPCQANAPAVDLHQGMSRLVERLREIRHSLSNANDKIFNHRVATMPDVATPLITNRTINDKLNEAHSLLGEIEDETRQLHPSLGEFNDAPNKSMGAVVVGR